MALTPKARQKAIDTIVANCDCWKREGDREILQGLSDDKIEDLYKGVEKGVQNARIAEFVTNEEGAFTDPDTGMTYRIDPDTVEVQRAMTANVDDEECDEEEDEEEEVPIKNKTTNNQRKPMTEQDFWRMAPPSLKKQHDQLVANEKRNRAALIDVIVNAQSDDEDERDELRESYAEVSTKALNKLARNAQRRTQVPHLVDNDRDEEEVDVPDYAGLGLAPILNRRVSGNGESDDHLVPPTINYEELSREWPNGRKVRE